MLKQWEKLPDFMKTEEVRTYWEALDRKRGQLLVKRIFDFWMALVLLVVLLLPMVIIAIMIKVEDRGPVFFRQERVTQYGRRFRIHKFRTMIMNAEHAGPSVTVKDDERVTKVGKKIRRLRLDELPQVLDVLCGDMSFVGTRPEVVKYVEQYAPEWNATLLLPAGITSETSIEYVNENQILEKAGDTDHAYLYGVLPDKMRMNLKSLADFSLLSDMKTMLKTVVKR